MLEKAKAMQQQLTAWRRDFHSHPELGFQESRTAEKVVGILGEFGIQARSGVGRTGVVSEIGHGKPLVAIRADMDALPLQEANQVPYASQNKGVMHACGHDAHTSMLLGAAVLLSREEFPGTVRLLFQPAEEVADEEGLSGAQRMIQAGVMDGVELALALHVDPSTAVGTIRIGSGPASGGEDSFFGEIIGTGGHAADARLSIDPFYLAAHVVLALNAIVSRHLDPFDPAVVSIGTLHGGSTENVIPERVKISGTLRFTQKRVQELIHAEIRRAFDLTHSLGGKYKLNFQIGTPPMINAPVASDLIEAVGIDFLGRKNVLPMEPDLGAEDFSCYLELVPGAMFSLGTGSENFQRQVHNPDFDLDESSLPIGVAILAESVLRYLRGSHNLETK
jgi:amidohydrolase